MLGLFRPPQSLEQTKRRIKLLKDTQRVCFFSMRHRLQIFVVRRCYAQRYQHVPKRSDLPTSEKTTKPSGDLSRCCVSSFPVVHFERNFKYQIARQPNKPAHPSRCSPGVASALLAAFYSCSFQKKRQISKSARTKQARPPEPMLSWSCVSSRCSLSRSTSACRASSGSSARSCSARQASFSRTFLRNSASMWARICGQRGGVSRFEGFGRCLFCFVSYHAMFDE
jgi:hypothetical protein